MHRIKAFGLTLMAAFGLMALVAVGAQAENLTPATHVHAKFLVEGSEHLATLAGLEGEQIGESSLLIPAKSAEIVCKKGQLKKLIPKASGEADGELELSECKVFKIASSHPYALEGELTACSSTLVQPIKAKVITLIIKHNSKFYIVIEPLTNPLTEGSLTTIQFNLSTCALPEEAAVKGSVAAEIDAENRVEHTLDLKTSETLTPGPGTHSVELLLGVSLSYGGNSLFHKALMKLKLTGTHAGKNWSVC